MQPFGDGPRPARERRQFPPENGAGFLEGVRNLVYFDNLDLGRHVLVLTLGALAGLAVLDVAALAERRRVPPPTAAEPEQELEQELEEVAPA
ncbi:hypothetical protein ACSNOI_18315 [Actinomadura kijaniata]|uniref:hypothetical protein n=1 Tax=Actinomadura kijaniata TaxID=46161 RepID=UPI003F1B713E